MIKSNLIALNDKASLVFDSFVKSYSIDPCGIYCLLTGKQIGLTHTDEWLALVDSLPDTDPSDCADDLAMRLFASMRPSMRWNKMRVESMDLMRKSAPVETMAYLLNRLIAPVDRRQSYITEHGGRIKLYSHLETLHNGDTALFDSVMHQLLEIDAKLHLSTLVAPFTAKQVRDCTTLDSLVALVDSWHTKMLLVHESNLKEARYAISNPLAKQAFFSSFMESKPPSKAATQIQRKNEDTRFFEEVFANMQGRAAIPQIQVGMAKIAAKPKPAVVSTQMPRVFGVKKVEQSQ